MPTAGQVTLTRILHPCVLLRRGGTAVLFDPCFGTFTQRPLTSRIMGIGLPAPGIAPEALGDLTVIALTHGHEDHFDRDGMARIPSRRALVIVPTSTLARAVRRLGFHNVSQPAIWETVRGEDWSVTAVPARSPNAWREVSYVADLGSFRVLHAGDTAAHGRFGEIRDLCAPAAACLPVNGVSLLGVRLTMSPVEAARAAGEMRLQTAVPIHAEMSFGGLSRLLYKARGTELAFAEAARTHASETHVLLAPAGRPVVLHPLA